MFTNLVPILIALAITAISLAAIFYWRKSHYLIIFLLIWYPVEQTVFQYLPNQLFFFFKYAPELLLYAAVSVAWFQYYRQHHQIFPRNPLNKYLLIFIAIAFVSFASNWYSPVVWALGLRQLLRFAFIWALIVLQNYPAKISQLIYTVMLAVVGSEVIIGLAQKLSGGALDKYLYFSKEIAAGAVTVAGPPQFWAAGARLFGTLGRYDHYGSFMVVGLLLIIDWWYERHTLSTHSNVILSARDRVPPKASAVAQESLRLRNLFSHWKTQILFIIGIIATSVALLFSSSRASYLAAFAGILLIITILKRDYRVLAGIGIGVILLASYLGFYIIRRGWISDIIDRPNMPIAERLLEAFSARSFAGALQGGGRFYFFVKTPQTVIANNPVLGVGLGNFGSGVAATLDRHAVYDQYNLPFGIQDREGQIDNNWWSLWAEVGTLGALAWLALLTSIAGLAKRVGDNDTTALGRVLGVGLAGIVAGIIVLGFFGPYFEFRTLMTYFWTITGLVTLRWREQHNHKNFLKV